MTKLEGGITPQEKNIQAMEAAILAKNQESFENQNDAQNFFVEQIKKFFPEFPAPENLHFIMSWNHEGFLCIGDFCRFARVVRTEKEGKESLHFENWGSNVFKDAIRQFLSAQS